MRVFHTRAKLGCCSYVNSSLSLQVLICLKQLKCAEVACLHTEMERKIF